MHGISTENIQISEAAEIMVYCLMDGKVDQKSVFESQLYDELILEMINVLHCRVETQGRAKRSLELNSVSPKTQQSMKISFFLLRTTSGDEVIASVKTLMTSNVEASLPSRD